MKKVADCGFFVEDSGISKPYIINNITRVTSVTFGSYADGSGSIHRYKIPCEKLS